MSDGKDDANAAAKEATESTAKAAREAAEKVDAASGAAAESMKASESASDAVSELQRMPSHESVAESQHAAEKAATSAQAASEAAGNVVTKIAGAKEGVDSVAKDAADAASKVQAATRSATRDTLQTVVAGSITTSYYDLLKAVVLDRGLSGAEKKEILRQLKGISPTSDRLTYRTAILLLGLIAFVTIGAVWHLMKNGNTPSEGLIAIASGAVGGLAGLLSPSRNADPPSSP